MGGFRIERFQGEVPRLSRRLLGDSQAQIASNVRLTNGNIEPLYQPKVIGSGLLCDDPKSIYRMYSDTGASFWLSWPHDVDVARGPIAGDEQFRIYFTSDSFEPRVTDIDMATSGAGPFPTDWFVLGVSPPILKPAVAAVGGSGDILSRAYCVTFVTPWGEESEPSPESDVASGAFDAVWTISNLDEKPPNTGPVLSASASSGIATLVLSTVFGLREGETLIIGGISGLSGELRIQELDVAAKTVKLLAPSGISGSTGTWTRGAKHNTTGMTRRLYRTVTSAAGTDYFFVKEFAFGTLSVVDDAGSAIGEALPTSGWAMPPATMQNVRVHPSGSLVGFSGNEVVASDPIAPYAFPDAYRMTTESPIVGIGLFGVTVVVGTAGQPYLIHGVDPESMSPTKMEQRWPCLSKRSFADMGYGVCYAAPQGLVLAGPGGMDLVTEKTFTFDEWREFSPAQMIGEAFDGRYYCAYPGGMLAIEADSVTRSNWIPQAIYTDHETGVFYVVAGGILYEWNSDAPRYMAGEWKSKEFVLPSLTNLGAAKIDAAFLLTTAERQAQAAAAVAQLATNAALIAASATRGSLNASSLNEFTINGSLVKSAADIADSGAVNFTLYVDDEPYYSTVRTDNEPFRLPGGSKYDNFAIGVSGNVEIKAILIGDSIRALGQA